MPLSDKYAFFAWDLKQKGMLGYESVNNPQFIDFAVLLLRDVFPDKKESLTALLNSNNNEFGKKMFADSIDKLVKLFEPYPFNKNYLVSCEAILSDYDFQAKRFQVFLDTEKKFNQVFRERTGSLTYKYKDANSIPIPFPFYDSRILSYEDKFSVYSKGWNYITVPADSAQKVVESINLNSDSGKKRKIFAQIEYSPVIYENRLIATNVTRVSYYLDADFGKLFYRYPVENENRSIKTLTVTTKSSTEKVFAVQPFIRNLNPKNDKVRFVVYKGVIESENILLNGKVFYHAVLFQKFEENGPNKYLQIMALGTNLGNVPNSIYWVQIGERNAPIWIEGYRGLGLYEDGKFGKKVGLGSELTVKSPKFMEKFEFSIIGIDKQRYSLTLNRLLIIFDTKGNEVARCMLTPFSDDLSTEPIYDKLKFMN